MTPWLSLTCAKLTQIAALIVFRERRGALQGHADVKIGSFLGIVLDVEQVQYVERIDGGLYHVLWCQR